MKRRIQFYLFFIIFSIMVQMGFAQPSAATKRLTAKVASLLKSSEPLSKSIEIPERMARQYLIGSLRGEPCVDALIKVQAGMDASVLSSRNIRVNNRIGNIWSVSIPLTSLLDLGKISGLVRIEIDTPLRRRLDLAGIDVRSLLVHQGTGLSQAYTGRGVVVGIVDVGFDFTHPAFQDAYGMSRIRAVWDMGDGSGSPPDGFTQGSEYRENNAIQDKQHDVEGVRVSHGSHIGGIAGGRGTDTDPRYTGMAPEADLVFVTPFGGATDIWDGIEYIFQYAQEENQPAVVNISMGGHIGPHDGTSLTDQVFDRLVGPGKIIVGSVGNEADSRLHLSHGFQGDTLATGPEMIYDGDEDADFATIEIWGSPTTSFSVAVGLFDTWTGTYSARSDFYASDESDYEEVQFYTGVDGEAGFTFAAEANNSENQSPNIQIELMNTTSEAIVLFVTSANSSVHLWHVDEAPFNDLGYPALFSAGDAESTMGEIGGTGKSVISVGAYTTKNTYTDINGQQQFISAYTVPGDLAPFSSHGPTRDGRVKPEICAPGNVVVAPISSFDTSTLQNTDIIVTRIGNNWPYAAFEGTSMSAPVVTGAVALMLEANPNLTKAQIVDIFKQTAREDGFTGDIPETGSNRWGFGKIDALEAVKAAENAADVSSDRSCLPTRFALQQNYPNPFNAVTIIAYQLPEDAKVHLAVYNITGQWIETLIDRKVEAGYHRVAWDGSQYRSGLYFYRLTTDTYTAVGKGLLVK